mmetsp:Transcript_23752/g.69552  ORF Transcript_23752/g.69552 Transcript_23752/m.69552 type:complete len:201 (-) Transcript_23752:496-1098(-)
MRSRPPCSHQGPPHAAAGREPANGRLGFDGGVSPVGVFAVVVPHDVAAAVALEHHHRLLLALVRQDAELCPDRGLDLGHLAPDALEPEDCGHGPTDRGHGEHGPEGGPIRPHCSDGAPAGLDHCGLASEERVLLAGQKLHHAVPQEDLGLADLEVVRLEEPLRQALAGGERNRLIRRLVQGRRLDVQTCSNQRLEHFVEL